MEIVKSPWVRGLFFIGLYAIIALSLAQQLVHSDAALWLLVGAITVGTGLLFGPFAWYLRHRVSADRRREISKRTTPVVLVVTIGGAIVLALVLSTAYLSAVALGMLVGVSVMLVIELLALPERLRSPVLR